MTHSMMQPPVNAEGRTGESARFTVKHAIAFVVPVAIALGIFIPPYIPLQDFNEWIYQGYLAAQMQGQPVAGPFAFVPYPVPNSLVQALLTGLNFVLSPSLAGTLVIVLYFLLAVAIGWKLAHKISPRHGVDYFLALLIFAYFNSSFWNGYINYQFGILLLSFYLLLDPGQRRSPGVVLAFSVVGFFTHAVIWGTLLLLFLLDAARRKAIRNYLPALPSVGLFVWYVALKSGQPAFQGFAPGDLVSTAAYKLYTVAKLGPYHNFAFGAGGDWFTFPLAYWAGVAINLVVAAVCVLIGVEAFLLARRRRRIDLELIAGAALLLFFLAMPAVVADVVNPGERMLYPAVLLILFRSSGSRLIRWAAWSSLVLAVCAIGLAFTGAETWKRATSANPSGQQIAHVLFSVRPNQFTSKVDVPLKHLPLKPLSFETSFLVNRKDGT